MIKSNSIIALTFALCLWLTRTQAQETRILYSSTDINKEQTLPRIKSIRGNSFSSYITVKYEDGIKKRVYSKEIWGYIEKGTICRRVGKSFFAIVHQADLIEYSSIPVSDYDITTNSTDWREGPHFFSKTLDSKVYPSAKTALNSN